MVNVPKRINASKEPRAGMLPQWLWLTLCGTSFFLGRLSNYHYYLQLSQSSSNINHSRTFNPPTRTSVKLNDSCEHLISKLQWKLDMKRARSYPGITLPLNNGYSAKCIPDRTMAEMNANYDVYRLERSKNGLSDGMLHADEDLLSLAQVGDFASKNMKFTDEG